MSTAQIERNLKIVMDHCGDTDDVSVFGRWAIDWPGSSTNYVLLNLDTPEHGGTMIAQGMNRKDAERIALAMHTADELMRIWD